MTAKSMEWLTRVTRELMQYDDTGEILNHILMIARSESHADAGTIFLVENDELVFAYTHNDTLFPVETAYKYAYADARLPITCDSIAGYCAVTRRPLNIPNVRSLPQGVPFTFNDSFDQTTGYKTVSMLTIPLVGRRGILLGVLQLINSMGKDGPQAFTPEAEISQTSLVVQAVSALERGILTREMIHRMQKMAEYSDPKETAPHAERVGAIAAEIYQRWAEKHRIAIDISRSFRADLRLAAMVHDLGKVAIPHEILKKPGKLTEQEFEIMKTHSAEGARLFKRLNLDVDTMAHDIALHHHQRWDGTGYTGSPDCPALSGEAIPLAARITAVADVFDALVSKRCYKDPWPWDKAVRTIFEESGSHFDPEVVDAFGNVQNLVYNIFERYKG